VLEGPRNAQDAEAAPLATVRLGEPIATADPRLFGSFVEHLGRGVYGGIYEPTHDSADARGFRTDVISLIRELGVTIVRYPGGNFVSGYEWRDGVGPAEHRPRRLDLAWKSIETNEFGTDEFIAWCATAGVEPMLALNLGLGSVKSALELIEYTNHPGGTEISEQRVANGSVAPHDVRHWCLGNELDGAWQLGHRSAEGYAAIAANAANAIRMFDADLKLVAVGSSNADMPTFGEWERVVLRETVDLIDYLSCHIYFYNDGDIDAFVRSSDRLDAFLTTIESIVRDAVAANPRARDVKISLDEWNVWNYAAYDLQKPSRRFEVAPRILEERYTVVDAIVVGSLLQTILAHADSVAIAAMAQLVNVIGPISAEPDRPAWRQTTFFPFAAAARSKGWTVLRTQVSDPDVLATVAEAPDRLAYNVYLTNRDPRASRIVEIPLNGMDVASASAWAIYDDDPYATNSADDPTRVGPRPLVTHAAPAHVRLELPPLSWTYVEVVASVRSTG
jgi:alpha-N-arabinofuranosidase